MSAVKRLCASAFAVVLVALCIFGFTDSASAASRGITVNKQSAAQGDSVTVTGVGFTAGAAVALTLHTDTLATTKADAAGDFTVGLTIPTAADVGTSTIIARENGTGQSAFVDLSVHAPVSTRGYIPTGGVAIIGFAALGIVLLTGGTLMLLAGNRRELTA